MKYCSECGTQVERRVPEGDSLERDVCPACDTIHYSNPNVVVGCIPVWEDKILLCKRAIEPRLGYWTLPAGFLEHNETTSQAGARETWEEACAKVEVGELFSMINVPYIGQIHMFYRAELIKPEFSAGIESTDVKLVTEDEIPWDEIAFPTVAHTLRWFLEDRKAGKFQLHTHDILARPPRSVVPQNSGQR
ncbi:MAG: NUDIX hydrolase [Nevskiales bacterium]